MAFRLCFIVYLQSLILILVMYSTVQYEPKSLQKSCSSGCYDILPIIQLIFCSLLLQKFSIHRRLCAFIAVVCLRYRCILSLQMHFTFEVKQLFVGFPWNPEVLMTSKTLFGWLVTFIDGVQNACLCKIVMGRGDLLYFCLKS